MCATFVLTITDASDGHVNAVAESKHPPIPFVDRGGEVDEDRLTPAQALGVAVSMWMAENVGDCDWRTLLKQDDDAAS